MSGKRQTDVFEPPSTSKKRPKGIVQHKWTPDEITRILDYLKETVQRGCAIEKPTAAVYYQKLAENLNLQTIGIEKMRSKVAYLKSTYVNAITWRGQTGQGVMEEEGEDSVKGQLTKICPYFDLLDEIYGGKVNVKPPYVFDSGNITEDESVVLELVAPESPFSAGSSQESDGSDVESMKFKLQTTSTKSRVQKPKMDVVTALTEFQAKRHDMLSKKIDVEEKRLENEQAWKQREFLHRESELKLKEKKLENEREMRLLEMEKEERIAKFKIQQEIQLQLELAKMKNSQ